MYWYTNHGYHHAVKRRNRRLADDESNLCASRQGKFPYSSDTRDFAAGKISEKVLQM